MSSLIMSVDEDSALVATDTLVTASNDRKPLRFTSKALFVPHLKIIIAGTGTTSLLQLGQLGLLDGWFLCLNCMAARGIDQIAESAQQSLASLWESYKQAATVPERQTSTIFTMGFSENTGRMRVVMSSSAYGFDSRDQTVPCIAAKPDYTTREEPAFTKDGLLAFMEDQRAVQRTLPEEGRLQIGGEIILHHLTRTGCEIKTVARFDDYDKVEKALWGDFRGKAAQS